MDIKRKAAFLTTSELFLMVVASVIAAILGALGHSASRSYLYAVKVLAIFVMCFFSLIFTVELISMFKISDSTLHTVLIAACLIGATVFSPDFALFLKDKGAVVDERAFGIVYFMFFVLLTLSVLSFQRYTYSIRTPRAVRALTVAAAALCIGAYAGLSFVGLEPIAYFVYVTALLVVMSIIMGKVLKSGIDDPPFYTTSLLLATAIGSSLSNIMCGGWITFAPYGFTSFYAICQIALFALTYIAFAVRGDRAALKVSEYKLKYERVRTEALRAQIKPHYIFNSLAAIQGLYRRSFELGDRAITLFSKHMRANVEAGNVDLIPFEKELDNIQAYIELENLCFDREFNVIFDIEYTDFYVPVLSLQPYIENSIRHSKVNEKPDGYIKISSRLTKDGNAVVRIVDNGVGFDSKSTPPPPV